MAHNQWSVAVDISHYQGDVDLSYIKQASGGVVKAVICKAIQYGYGWSFEQCVDSRWAANVQSAHNAGLPCGGYIYPDLAYNLRAGADNFANNQQAQFIIRALQNKVYHFLAVDIEEASQESLTPIQWITTTRMVFDHLKHARKQGLIRDVPIGLYSRNGFIADFTTAPDGGSLFDDTPKHEFLWEAKYMLPPASPVKAWADLKSCYPPDSLQPTAMNGIRYWGGAAQYTGTMTGKLVFWQFSDAWKFPLLPGKAPQAVDLNLIPVPDDQLYSWLKFTPSEPVDPEEPEEPEEPGEPEEPEEPEEPVPADLAVIVDRLDRIVENLDVLTDIIREVYNR